MGIWNTCCAKLDLKRPRSRSYHRSGRPPKTAQNNPFANLWLDVLVPKPLPYDVITGGLGHIAKRCTVARRTTSKEAEGDTKSSGMAMLTTTTPTFEEMSPSPIDREVARLHGLTSTTRLKGPELRPKYTLPVMLEGKKMVALIDICTGSSLTIVSLSFVLQAWWDQKKQDNPEQPKDAWSTEIKKHFRVPSVMLKMYDETPLTLFGEIPVTIENAGR